MIPSDCERGVDAGAYLLSALSSDDHRLFAEHLHACGDCRHEIEQLQPVIDTLPMAAPQLAPPPELKDRIMRVIDAEAQLLRAAGPEADRVPNGKPARERRLWRWGGGLTVRPALAGGIASVLIAVGVAGGVLLSGSESSTTRTLAAQVSAPLAPSAVAQVSLTKSHATLHVANLPSAPAGQVYQVWFIRKGSTSPEPTHTLFSVRKNDGRSTVPIEESVNDVGKILVTAESADGGAMKPSSDPIITASLR